MSEIILTIKFSNADKYEVPATLSDTVLEFKEKISSLISVPAAQQRLIYKGRVLKDEHQLETYEIQNGQTIHLVKGIATTSQPVNPTPTTSNPIPQQSNVQPANPFLNPAAGNNLNPAALGNMANMFGGNGAGGMPDINQMQQQLMQNPQMMQQIMNSPMMENLMNNPELMQNMMLNNPQVVY